MAALGDKVSANILAQTAKVPSIPWSGQGIECELNEEGQIPKEVFNQACVTTADEAAAMALKIGYPVMIKASEGGGGKGIRVCYVPSELKTNFIQVLCTTSSDVRACCMRRLLLLFSSCSEVLICAIYPILLQVQNEVPGSPVFMMQLCTGAR